MVNKTTTEIPNEPFRFEHALQEYILLHPEFLRLSDQMHEPEITLNEKRSQEFRYDLVINYTDSDDTAIVELKKEEIDDDAIRQIQKYLAAEKSWNQISESYWEHLLQSRPKIKSRNQKTYMRLYLIDLIWVWTK